VLFRSIGNGVKAIGDYSVALGRSATASGMFSLALSSGNASGMGAVSMGGTASGYDAWSFGVGSLASGSSAIAFGSSSQSTNSSSLAIGYNAKSTGAYATSIGNNSTAQSQSSFVTGYYNVIEGNSNTSVPTDPLFVIGNGTYITPSNAFTVLKNGNTGVGVKNPVSKFEVNGTANITTSLTINKTLIDGQRMELYMGGTGNRDPYIDFHGDDYYTDFCFRIIRYNTGQSAPTFIVHRGTGAFTLVTQEAAPIIFSTGNSEKLRIEPNGNVGINNSAPGQKLDISAGNGRVQSGYSWLTNSDIRYKKNITELEGALEKVMKLRGVRFDLSNDQQTIPGNGKYIGFIAQELEEQYPEFVVTEENGYKSVAYDKIGAVLVQAIKEQQQIIDRQQQQIEIQKNEYESLKSEIESIKALLKKQ
jgi:hypothetical protein